MLDKKYNHSEVEKEKYDYWMKKGYFKSGDMAKKPYCIVLPPPNVTGKLHLGHAWDVTLQDIIIRYKRMEGYDCLWLPGMDHAAIATEAKVVARLKDNGKNKYEVGRDEFLEECWKWTNEHASIIREQWAKLGISLDYSKERFTLDKGLEDAVKKVFVDYYNKGLIYRGEKIINWDPVAKTALSNEEVIYKEEKGAFYHLKYKLEDSDKFIDVATTRPETLFGDMAVAVNENDERYKDFVGKNVILPIVDRKIPVITDPHADMEKGTGAVKITPAHDPNDYEVGLRHNLTKLVIMNDDATMNENCGSDYVGLSREEARKKVIEDLENSDLLLKVEPITHEVGHSERTNAIIEPMVKKQWFVKMRGLADQVLANQKNSKTKVHFVPTRYEKTMNHWMKITYDWCISRQLWWGHRIPAWYKNDEVYVGVNPPKEEGWVQDEDVLDTWFSSALWPFATLGWPEDTELLKRYYPNNCLVTGYDIIPFWVMRMMFSGLEHTGKVPFDTVLIHGLVRDSQGRKMSKSLGNGIDPLEVIDKYGADALRFTLITGNAPGNDMRFYWERVEASRNFANKVWNASRFIQMNMPEEGIDVKNKPENLTDADKWILSKVNTLAKDVTENLDKFELGIAADKIYNFIWEEFCDWYIEMVKPRLYNDNDDTKQAALWTLKKVLIDSLKLLHPYMPFITEEIFCNIQDDEESIMISSWPEYSEENTFEKEEAAVETIKEAVRSIRNIRSEMNVAPSKKAKVFVVSDDATVREIFEKGNVFFATLGYASEVIIQSDKEGIEDDAVSVVIPKATIYMPFAELVDIAKEIERLHKEVERLNKELARVNGMLSNPNFVSKAPEKKINEEKEKKAKYEQMMEQVKGQLSHLEK